MYSTVLNKHKISKLAYTKRNNFDDHCFYWGDIIGLIISNDHISFTYSIPLNQNRENA